jgi:uncharacterized OB-fold protein
VTIAGETASADPRPALGADGRLLGGRCRGCGLAVAGDARRCPACRREAVEPAAFGPGGVVWSATTLHVGAPGQPVPFALAYVDLEDGPRILAHADTAPPVGAAVVLDGTTTDGDVRVAEVA